jgi:hypothetical protein
MNDGRFWLWHKWLLAVCLVVIAFGLFIALLSWTPLFGIFNGLVDGVFWYGSTPDDATGQFILWAYGMLGATMAGWGIALAYMVKYPFARKEKWSWNAIALGLAVWFVVDTFMSVYTKAYFNVGVNVMLIVLAGIPILMSRKSFD